MFSIACSTIKCLLLSKLVHVFQEAQRAAKEKAKGEKAGSGPMPKKEAVRVPDSVKADVPETQKRVAKKLEKQQVSDV